MSDAMALRLCVNCGVTERICKRGRPLCRNCRFYSFVEKTAGCWVWTGGVTAAGYAMFCTDGRHHLAHRLAYAATFGEIPDGLLVDHACRNRRCVNPSHLRLADKSQNAQNVAGGRIDNTSGYRGVTWSESNKLWYAEVQYRGRRYRSSHRTAEEANTAAVAMRNRLYTHNDADRGSILPEIRTS